MTPKLSIIIPSYNEKENIEAGALGQISSYLKKAPFTWEVIVSDDGSQDNTGVVVREMFGKFPDKESRLLMNPHEGPGGARNKGIEAARGEWIAFLDSDDVWLPSSKTTA